MLAYAAKRIIASPVIFRLLQWVVLWYHLSMALSGLTGIRVSSI